MEQKKLKLFTAKNNTPNILIASIAICLSIFGVVMIYAASSYTALVSFGDKFYFMKKQILGLVLGTVALIFFSYFNYDMLKKWAIWLYLFGVLLLVVVLIPGVSLSSYGARRWISIGGFSFQSSEIAKFCFAIYAAKVLSEKPDNHQGFLGGMQVIIAGILMCVLIMLEPNMSVTMLIGFVLIIMLFIGGLKLNRFLFMAGPAVLAAGALIILEPYRLKRLMAFIDPWASPLGEGYQLIQSLYSFGSGGLFGVGLFCSRQKYLFLPFSESDFIFSIIGEELGLFGCFIVIALFIAFAICGFKIAFNSSDRFGCYLAAGITSVVAVQILINIAVVTGSIPPTGLPLPFISAGSTSLVVMLAMVGVLINISKNRTKMSIINN